MKHINLLISYISNYRTREEMLIQLRKNLSQKSLFSHSSSVNRLPKVFFQILSSFAPSVSDNVIVRMKPNVMRIIRRVERLNQITSDITSIRNPLDMNSSLLVAFNKIRYPKYDCILDSNIFENSKELELYEAACEIYSCLKLSEKELENILESIIQESMNVFILSNDKDLIKTILDNLIKEDVNPLMIIGILGCFCFFQYNLTIHKMANEEYLHQFNAGYILTSICFHFITQIEKDPFRYYELATFLLEVLIVSNYAKHRHGKWFIRLCVDYDHLNEQDKLCHALYRARVDSYVKLGERNNLNKRFQSKGIYIQAMDVTSNINTQEICYEESKLQFIELIQRYFFISKDELVHEYIDLTIDESLGLWSCEICTFLNNQTLSKCEICESNRSLISNDVLVNINLKDSDSSSTKRRKVRHVESTSNINDNDNEDNDNEEDSNIDGIDMSSPLREFTLFSRRFGEVKLRKNRFVNDQDELVSVERFIMDKCYHVDSEDIEESPEFQSIIDEGMYQGWHCEGSPLRCLFGLLMWDIIYSSNTSSSSNVFISPYQEYPLDLYFPCFYDNRKQMIDEYLIKLSMLSNREMIQQISEVYRRNYRCQNPFISWSISLSKLQLIAIAIGRQSLSFIFSFMCKSYKHFRSGMPDLLLLRIRKVNKNGKMTSFIEMEDILQDENWKDLHNVSTLSEPPLNENSLDVEVNVDDENQEIHNMSHLISPLKNADVKVKSKLSIASFFNKGNKLPDVVPSNDTMENIEASLEVEHHEEVIDLQDHPIKSNRFECKDKDLELPSSDDLEYDYHYDILFIEVKGPNDTLSDKQIVWLHLLQNAKVNAVVGHCREKK